MICPLKMINPSNRSLECDSDCALRVSQIVNVEDDSSAEIVPAICHYCGIISIGQDVQLDNAIFEDIPGD